MIKIKRSVKSTVPFPLTSPSQELGQSVVEQSVLLPANEPPREKQVSTVVTVQVPEMQHAPSLEQFNSEHGASRISPPLLVQTDSKSSMQDVPRQQGTGLSGHASRFVSVLTTTSPLTGSGELSQKVLPKTNADSPPGSPYIAPHCKSALFILKTQSSIVSGPSCCIE